MPITACRWLRRRAVIATVFRLTTTLLAFAVAVSLAASLSIIWGNAYLASGQYYLAASILASRLNTDILFAIVVCAITTMPMVAVPRLGQAAMPYTSAAALCLIGSRGVLWREWSIDTVAYGFTVPLAVTGRWKYWMIGTIIVLSVATLVGRAMRRHRSCPGPEPRNAEGPPLQVALLAAVASLLILANGWRFVCAPVTVPRPAPVIWVTWDSVRADRLSSYGYPTRTTPNVDSFAKDSVLFERAFSQDNWTRPSYSSMFTSRHVWEMPFTDRMDQSVWTLAEALKAAGYRTVAQVQNPNLDASFNFDQGFDRYIQLSGGASAVEVSRRAVSLLSSLAHQPKPFFLFIHFQEPHYPYHDPTLQSSGLEGRSWSANALEKVNRLMSSGKKEPSFQSESEELLPLLQTAYDSDVRITDDALLPILRAIKSVGLYDRSIIIFNSDHGDELYDSEGFGHGRANVHSEVTWVPLLIRFPHWSGVRHGSRVRALVRNLDVYPTILDVIGVRLPGGLSGRSVRPESSEPIQSRVSYSNWGSWLAIRTDRYSFVLPGTNDSPRVYDLQTDPQERAPLAASVLSADIRPLEELARKWRETVGDRVNGKTETRGNKELMQRLRSLGYVQ